MRLRSDVVPYLEGREFSNGLAVEFDMEPVDRVLLSRIAWLERLCAGKDVIHAGCVDHSPEQIQRKHRKQKWLHSRLSAHAKRCHGIDKNREGIDFIRGELGYDDVECMDLVTEQSEIIRGARWDYLVLAEILEHIDNPVAFLAAIRARYAGCVAELIITVPNAFARENFQLARRSVEAINTDHRYWFTPYTLAKVATSAGLAPRHLLLCRNGVIKRRSVIKNARLRRYPLLRNNIIMVAGLIAPRGGTA